MSDRRSPNRLEQFASGEYVFHVPTGEVYRVQSLNVAYDEATGRPDGTVTVTVGGDDATMEHDATTVAAELCDGDLVPVPDRLVDDPEGVLLAFARQELSRYTSRLSDGHDYRGIDGVELIAHLRAASYLAAHAGQSN